MNFWFTEHLTNWTFDQLNIWQTEHSTNWTFNHSQISILNEKQWKDRETEKEKERELYFPRHLLKLFWRKTSQTRNEIRIRSFWMDLKLFIDFFFWSVKTTWLVQLLGRIFFMWQRSSASLVLAQLQYPQCTYIATPKINENHLQCLFYNRSVVLQ